MRSYIRCCTDNDKGKLVQGTPLFPSRLAVVYCESICSPSNVLSSVMGKWNILFSHMVSVGGTPCRGMYPVRYALTVELYGPEWQERERVRASPPPLSSFLSSMLRDGSRNVMGRRRGRGGSKPCI